MVKIDILASSNGANAHDDMTCDAWSWLDCELEYADVIGIERGHFTSRRGSPWHGTGDVSRGTYRDSAYGAKGRITLGRE